MKIGVYGSRVGPRGGLEALAADARQAQDDGLASYWLPQWMSVDALTVFAAIAPAAPDIDFGTAVVPIAGRHPLPLAMQVMTTQAATRGRLQLGLGLSHRPVVEDQMGLPFDAPARRMEESLAALDALLRTGEADVDGEFVRCRARIGRMSEAVPPILLAALGPRMLDLAGRAADGTILWLTGPRTIEDFIVPRLSEAARAAGRSKPRIVAALPVCVTDDPASVRARVESLYAEIGLFSSYARVLGREGATGPADVAIVGDEARVGAALDELRGIGVTEFVAMEVGRGTEEVERTRDLLRARAGTPD